MPKGRLEKKIYCHDTDCGGVICACVDSNLKAKPIPAVELSKLKIV